MAMRLLDLFSGIGGFSYAAEKLIGGYETVAFCEMDDFCQKVLKKHWPQVPIFDDVRTLDATRLGRIDIVTGGYPCQPFSQAGRRQGEKDERHLWPEMLRIIKSCQPRYVLAENVAGHVTMGLDQVLTDLEDQGYTTRPIILPACAKNAPHRRDRVWIIGQLTTNTNDTGNRASRRSVDQEQQTIEQGWEKQSFFEFSRHDEAVANTDNEGLQRHGKHRQVEREHGQRQSTEKNIPHGKEKVLANTSSIGQSGSRKSVEPISSEKNKTRKTSGSDDGSQRGKHDGNIEQRVGNMADGISRGLLRHFDREPEHIPRVTKGEKDRAKKLKALGNSIVPQVAAEILLAIRVSEESD